MAEAYLKKRCESVKVPANQSGSDGRGATRVIMRQKVMVDVAKGSNNVRTGKIKKLEAVMARANDLQKQLTVQAKGREEEQEGWFSHEIRLEELWGRVSKGI